MWNDWNWKWGSMNFKSVIEKCHVHCWTCSISVGLWIRTVKMSHSRMKQLSSTRYCLKLHQLIWMLSINHLRNETIVKNSINWKTTIKFINSIFAPHVVCQACWYNQAPKTQSETGMKIIKGLIDLTSG